MKRRRSLFLAILIIGVLLLQSQVHVQRVLALGGVYHNPYGHDDLYSTDPTERAPRDPMAGDSVSINATTWPIESGQTVWVTWTKNGVNQSVIGAAYNYNSGNNTYWRATMGSFARGDNITYDVHANVNGGGEVVTGPFSFKVTSWSNVTNVTGYTNNGTSVDLNVGDSAGSFSPKIRFAFPTLDSFRLQLAPSGTGLSSSGQTGYTVTDSGGILTIATSALVLKIQKAPYRLFVYKGDGTTLITSEYDPTIFHNLGWASDGSSTITKIEDHYLTPTGEHFNGFGERYDYLDQRGQDVNNYIYNQYQNQGATHRTYLSVPFFINSAGYGIYIPSTYYSIFNIGTYRSDMAGFTADTGGSLSSTFDYYFFAGTPKTILDRYTSISGRPQLPPKWAFGPWMSANEWHTQAQVTNTLNNMNSYNIPATVLVLEQWSDEATFYIWHDAQYTPKSGDQSFRYSDFTFPSNGAWQDPKAMVTDAHNRGVKVVLWQIPVLKQDFNTNPPTAPQQHLNDMSYAQAQNYVIGDGNGGQYRIPSGQWFGDSMMPDFTNSAAANWWLSKRAYLINDVGVDGFKDDGGEMVFGRNLTFADGRKGDQMHNAYPGAYTGAYNTYLHSQIGSNGTLFSRGGTAGAQGTSIYWSGDQTSTFGSFQEAVRAGISAGASGVPFWSWDLAGFTGGFPTSELYLRAAAMAAFAPVMQYHSEGSNPTPSEERTPWNVQARTGDTTVIPTFQKFADVRMNLIPYIYTEAKRSADTGTPMMRAMSVEFPTDPNAATLDQQYMFGDQLLVAPVTTQGATTENIYVPSGEWYDFWNSGRFIGSGTKTYGVPLNLIPVYARPGAIIPLNLNANYQLGGAIGNSVTAYTNLTFRIYPDGTSSYGYYDDATSTTRTIQSVESWGAHSVTVSMPAMPTASTLQIIATQPSAVTRDGTTLTGYSTLAGLQSASEGWYWDPVLQATLVKLPASANARSIVLSGVDKASYEGEFATGSGTTTNTNHANYTGIGFVDSFDAPGKSVSFDVNASAAAAYQLRFRYANALGATATRQIYVDNNLVGTLSLPALTNWDTWGTASLGVTLGQGKHTVKIAYENSNSTAINLDNLTLARQ